MIKEISVKSTDKIQFIDITSRIRAIADQSTVTHGFCHIFVPHTTAAITINENADPDVTKDIINALNRLVPLNYGYSHSEGNSAAHIKAGLLGFSLSVFIQDKTLALGTWQGIYFAEFDGPRTRKVWVKII